MEKKQAGIEEEEEMIPFSFPDEIEEEILLRLPTKSLIQFKLVSKPWKTRITSSQFAQKHLKYQSQTNKRKLNLMLHGSGGPLHSLSLNCNYYDVDANAKLVAHNQPMLPDFVDHQKHRFHILGSCDGLLLVVVTTLKGDNAIYLWNPITGEYKLLPQVTSHLKRNVVFGFGRDLTADNNNYKVLYLETVEGELEAMEFKVNMYTTHTNSWKPLLPNIPFMRTDCAPKRMVLAYNHLHHLAEIDTTDDDQEPESIISFDLKDDKFRELPLAPGSMVNLCNLNGHLCALTTGHEINLNIIWRMENFGVKEQESWTKLFSIDRHVVMDQPIGIVSPLHVLDDGQILLGAYYCKRAAAKPFVICYCTREKKAKFLVQGDGDVPFWSIPVVYEESLISPNAASTVEEELPKQLKRRRT